MGRLLESLPPDGLSCPALQLRPLDAADADWLAQAAEDPDIVRWNGVPVPFSTSQAAGLIERRRREWADDSRAAFAIVATEGGPGGYASLRVAWPRGIGEIGYWLLPSHRGLGVATRAVRLIRDWSFDVLGLTRLQAGIQPGNAASEAVVLRLAFTREGLLRNWDTRNGVLHHEWMFALLPDDPRL